MLFMWYIFKGMHCKLLAAELEKCLSFVSCACPHLCVLTPKSSSGIPAVLPTQGNAWVSPDNARAIQLTTINLQASTSTFSVFWDPKSAEWLFYFSLIVAFLCNGTSKIDTVNWFLAFSHSLEGRQEFECSWGFQQAGQLGNWRLVTDILKTNIFLFPFIIKAAMMRTRKNTPSC